MDIPSEVYDVMESMIKTVVKKEKQRVYYKKWKQKNPNYFNKWYSNNKDTVKNYYQQQKPDRQKYQLNYYHKNKEEINKIYRLSNNGKRVHKIASWKHQGLISDDYNAIYEKVMNTTNCEECNVLLTEDIKNTNTTRCMDHDHTTGLFRNVLCLSCNNKRG